MTHDLIIIGGGPAGAAAAVYASRKRLKTLMVVQEFGGQSTVSLDVENWIGTTKITGEALAKNLKEHVNTYKSDVLELIEGVKVTSLEQNNPGFTATLDDGRKFKTRTILIASGSGRKKLEVPGAAEFENKGISYCASCDGPLFADMDVIVVGGGNAAFDSVAQLVAYCKGVTILHRSDTFRADEITVDKVLQNEKVKVYKNVDILEITGEQFVSGIKFKDKNTNAETSLAVTGIFVEIGQIPNTDFTDGVVKLDEHKKIIVDPMNGRTSVSGIWAAGDATNGLYHQNNIAAGDAVKALEDIYMWIHKQL